MRHVTRYGSALLVGMTAALAACSKGDTAADSAAPAAASADSTAPAPAATDSAAGGSAALSAPNVASLIGLTNASEVGQAKIAQDKATNGDVKAFAKQMIAEHEAMQKSLDSLATAKNLTPVAPQAQADQMKQADSQTLGTLNSAAKGAAFDKAYVDAQVAAHQKALNDLQSFAGSATDADLKALIEQAIPKVQAHLDKAQSLQSKVGAP